MKMEWYMLHTSFCLLLLLIIHQAATQSLSEHVTATKITITTTQPPLIGDHCVNSSTCAHLNNTECINNLCLCKNGFFNMNNITCFNEVDLGSNCSNVTGEQVCKDANAACSFGKCTCGSNYYDNNGALPAGTCQPITNLQVMSIVYGTITEKTIPIFWTPPNDTAAVSHYRVAYWPADTTTINNQQNVGNQTSFDLINLDPGKKYSIRIFTVNTQTDLTERSTSLTKNQTTKPGIPGALVKNMDIDASSGIITLEWHSSIGVVTGYGGHLENTTLFIYNKTFNTSGIIPSQTFSGLKNGTWYNFTEQAVVGYADTKTLYSEIYSQLIRTKVQVPNPPTNVSCLDATDRAITLKWIQPQLPNGDIISYIITIQQTQPSKEPYNITSQGTNVQYTVDMLTAGSFYTFQVYTRNENYTSTSFAQKTSCETKHQMAQAPEDLFTLNVTNRSGIVTWNKPSSLNGTLYGYCLQILNDSSCVREVIWKCTDCQGAFPSLPKPCLEVSQQTANSTALLGPQYYAAMALFPDTNYTVNVAAITGVGRGHPASTHLATKEEVPGNVLNLTGNSISSTEITVHWIAPVIRPGKTVYHVEVRDMIEGKIVQNLTADGYTNQSLTVRSLQEYWVYQFIVYASTSKGSSSVVISDNVTTEEAAPEAPIDLDVIYYNGSNCDGTMVNVTWKDPTLEDRNGKIVAYIIEITKGIVKTYRKNITDPDPYSNWSQIWWEILEILPDREYDLQVQAITETKKEGMKAKKAFKSITCKKIHLHRRN